jgi:hypothetical protein
MDQKELDDTVTRWVALKKTREEIDAELVSITERLRLLGRGRHPTTFGVNVTVQSPPRVFNPDTALRLIPPAVLSMCTYDGYDPKKLRAHLTAVNLLDAAMDPGTGNPRVMIT